MELLKYFTQLKRFFSKLYRFLSFFSFTKDLPMDLGYQEVPGGKKNMTLFINIFLCLQVNLHFKRNLYLNFMNMSFVQRKSFYSLYLKTNTYSGSWISLWPPRPLKEQKTGLAIYNRYQMCSFSLTTLSGGVCNYSFLKITSCETVTVIWHKVKYMS